MQLGTVPCPNCGVPLLIEGHMESTDRMRDVSVTVTMSEDGTEHLARCLGEVAPAPLWMRCSVLGCTWRVEFAAPSQDWDGYVLGVSSGAEHMRSAHDNEPAAQEIERWLLDQARQAGRAVEERTR